MLMAKAREWIGCRRKIRHKNRNAARRAASKAAAKYRATGLTVYHCAYCNGWHLTKTKLRPAVRA